MFELIIILGIGLVFIKLGFLCLGYYQEQFADNSKMVISWELFVQALGAGSSWGRIGTILLFVGVVFCAMSDRNIGHR